MTLTYFWKVKKFKIVISLKWEELAQKGVADICRFWHLPLNDVIVKIVWHDLDLLFEVKQFNNFYISETVRASAKNMGDLCRFLYLPSNGVIAKIILYGFDLLSEGQHFKMLISLNRWETVQNAQNDF